LATFDADTGRLRQRCDVRVRSRRSALRADGNAVAFVGLERGELLEWTLDERPPERFMIPTGDDDLSAVRRGWAYEVGICYGLHDDEVIHAAEFIRWAAGDLDRRRNRVVSNLLEGEALLPHLVLGPNKQRLYAAGPRKLVTSFDVLTGRRERTFHGHSAQVFCVELHQDGRVLASGSNDDTIRVWDTLDGEEILTLTGHERYVHDLAFSPDGLTLYSASGDGTIGIWSAMHVAERVRRAREERARSARLRSQVKRLLDLHSDVEAVQRWIATDEFTKDESDRATARDLVLELTVARGAPR
jgi:hypothetical protein